jgi:hypothetical protein
VLSYVPAGTTTLTHADELINIRMPLLPVSSVGCKHTSLRAGMLASEHYLPEVSVLQGMHLQSVRRKPVIALHSFFGS